MAEQDKKANDFALEDFKLKPISSAETIKSTLAINESDDDILSINDVLTMAAKADSFDGELDLTDEGITLKSKESETIEEIEEIETETVEAVEAEPEDPIFKELSAPVLPELIKENRARLQMQSPTKIHFYWSFKENPLKILSRIFGNQTNYQLVAKLQNQTSSREELFPIDTEGAAWFDVDAGSSYRVEVGFYAVSRPFVRVLFSNTLQTPRKSPSPRQDYSEYFAVSADQFAKVLNVSGYQQDAYEVALAGDDIESADRATETAFAQIFEAADDDFDSNHSGEMRFVLLALASGYSLEDLRGQISPSLFNFLQARAEKLSAEKALTALQENFGVSDEEIYEDEVAGETVFGASLVGFPRRLKRRTLPTKPNTLSKIVPLSSLR